jgi:hypothetical protein
MQNQSTQNKQENLKSDKTVFDVEGQKEIMDYAVKTQTRLALKTLLIVLPITALFAIVAIYILYKVYINLGVLR